MTDRYDAIVVGAGHNGLVCAALLAKAGKQVLVLEANERIGGAAVTREFADGYSVSACAHLLYQLQPAVRRALKLRPQFAAKNLATVALGDDGRHVHITGHAVHGVSDADAGNYRAFHKRMARFADLLRTYLNKTPPRLGTKNARDLLTLGRLGFDIRRLGRKEMQEFLRLIGMNIHDEVAERFEHPLLKGAVCLDAVLGTHLGPRSPNTIMTYLYRLAADHGRIASLEGGMGSISEELGQAAAEAGADIRTETPVERILVENGRVTGVATVDGERFNSYTVVSNADPRRTLLDLVGARFMETGAARQVTHFRSCGNASKLHLALDTLPEFVGLKRTDYAERLVIAPDEHYVERAFNPAKYGETSPEPVLEITFPTYRDARLAPAGKHVMSAIIQYSPYALKGGWSDGAKADLEATAIRTIERYAPDITRHIAASELLTPADIEREFHITGGHWHHGELALDQFLFVRPICGFAQYGMPVDGLFLCGAGAHPGGGVTGAPGRNAANEIIAREKTA